MKQIENRYYLGLYPLGRLGKDQSFRQEFEKAKVSLEFQGCPHDNDAGYGSRSAHKVERELYKRFAGVPVSVALFEIVHGWPTSNRLQVIVSLVVYGSRRKT